VDAGRPIEKTRSRSIIRCMFTLNQSSETTPAGTRDTILDDGGVSMWRKIRSLCVPKYCRHSYPRCARVSVDKFRYASVSLTSILKVNKVKEHKLQKLVPVSSNCTSNGAIDYPGKTKSGTEALGLGARPAFKLSKTAWKKLDAS